MDKKVLVSLLRKSQKGDKEALEQLCKISEQLIRNYFIYKFRDLDTVNDLCQETYTRLIKSLPNIREPLKYKNFLLKIAFHVTQDFFRKKSSEKKEKNNFEDLNESGLYMNDINATFDEKVITQIDIRNAIKRLPKKSQQILKMQSEGYKYLEIAEKFGLTESAIKMQIKRSLKKLYDLLFTVTFFTLIMTELF